MATGAYGINIPSNITSDDIDIYYNYSSDRTSSNAADSTFNKLNSNILVKAKRETDTASTISGDTTLEGIYQLKLPADSFSQKGFYNIYIKPKEIPAIISDVSVLASYPDVRGIVIDPSTLNNSAMETLFKTNNGIIGYRIIYYDTNNERTDDYRIVTSNFKAEPVIQNISNSNQKNVRYVYNDSGSLVFITLNPSSSPTFKANATPFIGTTSQQVLFVNTKFNPVMVELEITTHDADTISTMLENTQIRNRDYGLITTLDDDGNIYHQSENYELKDANTGKAAYEIHKKRTSVDFSQTLDNIENA